jgi:Bacterial PH domain
VAKTGPAGGPERKTLRYWPWLVLCGFGAALFGLLTALAINALANASSPTGYVITGLLSLGLGALAVYSIASLRTRTILAADGATLVEAFSRRHTPWSDMTRLDVTHSLPGWTVRAWTNDDDAVALYLCHDTHGRRPKAARTFEEPPPDSPGALRLGYTEIDRYRRASVRSA